MRLWLRKNVRRLALILAFSCVLEITFQWIEGTRPNVTFSWGHYNETLAVIGAGLFLLYYSLRDPPEPLTDPAPAAELRPPAASRSKSKRRRRPRH